MSVNIALARKDWDKAYEDFKVLEQGGRNLHFNERTPNLISTYHFTSDKSVIEDSSLPSGFFIRFGSYVNIGQSSSFYMAPYAPSRYSEDFRGKYVTTSLLVRGNTPFSLSGTSIGTEWTRFEIKGEWKEYNRHLYILEDTDLTTIDISSIKVEMGDKASPWTPTPKEIGASPFVADLAEASYKNKVNREHIRELSNAITNLGGTL